MAGAYLGVGEPDVVINVGVSGPGVVKKAIDRALEHSRNGGKPMTLLDVAEVIKRTAYKVTRVGEMIGNEVAQRLGLPFGVADLSLAPTRPWATAWARSSRAWACPASVCLAPRPCWPCSTMP